MAESAILLGATGLTGSFLLNSLLTDEEFSEVIIPVRNKTGIVHSKLKERVVDFSDLAAFRSAITPAGVMFCCIGTTMKRSEEHTSELQSRENLVCRLLLEQ